MKRKKVIITAVLCFSMLFLLAACGKQQEAEPVNEMDFSLRGIKDLEISYDEENIRFFKSEGRNLIVKEYMSKDKKRYYAKVSQNEKGIHISEGGKPLLGGGFSRRVEVYLPRFSR